MLSAGLILCQSAWAGSDPATSYPNNDAVITVAADGNGGYKASFSSLTNDINFSYITSVAIADIDHDGFPDVVLGVKDSAGGGIQVLMNDATGSGIVVYKTTLSTGASKTDYAQALVVVDMDMDKDGWPDIVTGNGADGTVSVLLNDKTGGFSAPHLYAAGSSTYGLIVQDLTGDGAPDVVTADSVNGGLDILVNDGHGNLGTAIPHATGFPLAQIQILDWNHDGLPDIVAYTVGAGMQIILQNNGNGTFTSVCGSCSTSGGGVTLIAGGGSISTDPGSNVGGSVSVGGTSASISVTSGGSIKVVSNGSSKSANGGGGSSESTPSTSGGGGALDWLSLALLGAAAWSRRRRPAICN